VAMVWLKVVTFGVPQAAQSRWRMTANLAASHESKTFSAENVPRMRGVPSIFRGTPTRASSILGKRRRECAQLDVPARGERILTDRAVVSKNNFHAPFIAADFD